MMQDDGSIQVQKRSNLFDLSTDLVLQATKFCTSGLPCNLDNSYMLFVLNNTMNDPIMLGEETVSILIDDNHLRIDIRKLVKERNHFLSIFSLLDETSISEHINVVENFQTSLKIAQKDQQLPEIKSRSFKVETKSFKRKNFNLERINKIRLCISCILLSAAST